MKNNFETLDLKRVWEILNLITQKEDELAEINTFYRLLSGSNENYYIISFEEFITYYSFRYERNSEYHSKKEIDTLVVYNDDPIPYEDFRNDEFIRIPVKLLTMSDDSINIWIEERIKEFDIKYIIEVEQEKENLQAQIENLQERLNKL